MKPKYITLLAFAGLLIAFSPPAVADAECPELTAQLQGRVFVAKKPLYDTKVALEGIVKLERDKEEIPEGASFTVIKVDCKSKKVELALRQNLSYKKDKVEVHFLFTAAQRAMPDADGNFEKMMSYVFEYPEDDAKSKD